MAVCLLGPSVLSQPLEERARALSRRQLVATLSAVGGGSGLSVLSPSPGGYPLSSAAWHPALAMVSSVTHLPQTSCWTLWKG